MELIILQGKKNTGKTSTLEITYQLLLQHGYTQVTGCFHKVGDSDFLDVLEHQESKMTVGIVTQSDSITDINYIKESLVKLEGFAVRKVIFNSTLGEERAKIKEVLEEYEYHELDKIIANSEAQQRIVNNWDANKILSHII